LSANESSLAPISVSILNLRAIKPSRASDTRLITKKIANNVSFPATAKYRIKGKASNLEIVIRLGIVNISFNLQVKYNA
jgi:pyridoxal biosynthesis lyase PdxS